MSVAEGFSNIKNQIVTEVAAGTTATLTCDSNDYEHNFLFWMIDKNKVIGPGNDFDERKYKYEVLSGKLYINVSFFFVSQSFNVDLDNRFNSLNVNL